jgi:hypothetical protein
MNGPALARLRRKLEGSNPRESGRSENEGNLGSLPVSEVEPLLIVGGAMK